MLPNKNEISKVCKALNIKQTNVQFARMTKFNYQIILKWFKNVDNKIASLNVEIYKYNEELKAKAFYNYKKLNQDWTHSWIKVKEIPSKIEEVISEINSLQERVEIQQEDALTF